MSEARRSAEVLLGLLREYVASCDLWEDYNRCAAEGEFASRKEEKAQHQHIQQTVLLPLMEKCSRKGFKYAGFLSMIPPAFETTKAQRQHMLEDMERYVEEEYPHG